VITGEKVGSCMFCRGSCSKKKEHKVLELSVRQRRAKENSNVFVYEGKVAT
jgi:hypothetical protein